MTGAEWEVVAVVGGSILSAFIAAGLGRRASERQPKHPARWVLLAALVTFASYGTIGLLKLRAYNMGAEDLGRVDQAVWSVLAGEPLVFSASESDRPLSRMIGHIELLYIPLAPLFLLWDSAGALLVAQAALVALGAWPAYRLGQAASGSGLGVAAAVAYLAHPAVGYAALADVHGDTLAMPLLLFALERGQCGDRRLSFAALALAVAAKEYVALLAVSMGIYWLLSRRDRKLAAASIALGLAWGLVVVPALHHRYRPADLPALTPMYFGKLGATPAEVVATAITRPQLVLSEVATPRKMGITALLLAPLAFAPLAAPGPLFAALPVFLPLAVTEQLDLRNHHNATVVPFLILAAVLGARRLFGRQAAVALLAATAVTHLTIGPSPLAARRWTPGRWDYLPNPHQIGRTPHDEVLDQAIAMVPAGARVTASGHLVPHLSHRPVCFTFPGPTRLDAIDAVLVDLVDAYPPPYRPRASEIERLRQVLADPAFSLHLARDGVFLLLRGPQPAPTSPAARETRESGPVTVGPLSVTRRADGALEWRATETIVTPLLILRADDRAILLEPSVPLAPLPWPAGAIVVDHRPPPSGTRIEVLQLSEGLPALNPRTPPQPWLPDPILSSRLLP